MQIMIVGAGIGGLSAAISLAQAGHKVKILESAPRLAEIGAGVQMTPDAIKYFFQWGMQEDILAKATFPGNMCIHNGKDGSLITAIGIRNLEKFYGAPYIVVHRAVLHDILHQHALKAGVEVRVNSRVVEYDFEAGSVVLKSGEKVNADLVVAADGINSFARRQFYGESDKGAVASGWAAYRMKVDTEKIRKNPLTASLIATFDSHLWVGESRSAMTYMVNESKMLNMVMSHCDDVDTSSWTPEQYAKTVKELFAGWDESLLALIEMADPAINNWPVYQVLPLPNWTSKSGRFVMMGDATHAMCFYLSMGVSLAVEDAAALTECLNLATRDKVDLSTAMSVFETVRKTRAEAVQKASKHAGDVIHLPSGLKQEKRNTAMKIDEVEMLRLHESGEKPEKVNESDFAEGYEKGRDYVYGIADHRIRSWVYGYDAIEPVRVEWERRVGGKA